jgi:hypothetical protein
MLRPEQFALKSVTQAESDMLKKMASIPAIQRKTRNFPLLREEHLSNIIRTLSFRQEPFQATQRMNAPSSSPAKLCSSFV